jgi:hypothetical protein
MQEAPSAQARSTFLTSVRDWKVGRYYLTTVETLCSRQRPSPTASCLVNSPSNFRQSSMIPTVKWIIDKLQKSLSINKNAMKQTYSLLTTRALVSVCYRSRPHWVIMRPCIKYNTFIRIKYVFFYVLCKPDDFLLGPNYVAYWKKKIILWYDMIYLLTETGFTPGGSSTVHIYIQTVHRTTRITTSVGRLSGIRIQSGQTNLEECGPCPVFAGYTLAFALLLRKKYRKTSVRVAGESQRHDDNTWCVQSLKSPNFFLGNRSR